MKSITDRKTGLRFEQCLSLAKESSLFIDLSGNSSSWAGKSTKENKKRLAKFLREAARKIEGWEP